MQVVGDTAMQYDTGYAALPWAAIRFFLQITVNDVETFCTTLQSVERVSHILVTSKVIECLYLQHQRYLLPQGIIQALAYLK